MADIGVTGFIDVFLVVVINRKPAAGRGRCRVTQQ
jgi:hypothetical protein